MTAPALPGGAGPLGGSREGSLVARLTAEQSTLRTRSLVAAGLAVVAVIAIIGAVGASALSGGRWLAWPRFLPALIWIGAAVVGVLVARWLRARNAATLSIASLAGVIEREQSFRARSLRGAREV